MQAQLKASVLSREKVSLRWWKNAWNLKAPTRGLIYLFHGMGEHSARYNEMATYFTQWGFDVLSFDLPGHGLTGRKGSFERFADFDEMKKEAKAVLQYWMLEGPQACAELRAKPVFLMGHSMGALLALYWVSSEKSPEDFPFFPKRVLISSPPVALSLKVPFWKELAAEFLSSTFPDIKLGNEISPDTLSHDRVKTYEYVQDPLRLSKASPRLYISMKKTMAFVRANFLNIQMPLMLINGSEDPIIHHDEMKTFYNNLNTHKKWVEYKGMLHEVFNEIGREKVYEEVIKWFLH
jgi:alpha-beta hydrolase superfamily lysophospholipase